MNCKHGFDKNTNCYHCMDERRKRIAIKVRRILGKISVILWSFLYSSGTTTCVHCGMVAFVIAKKDLDYGDGSGSVIMCHSCWEDLTPHERLFYYKRQWEELGGEKYKEWKVVELAVLGRHQTLWMGSSEELSQKEDYEKSGTLPLVK